MAVNLVGQYEGEAIAFVFDQDILHTTAHTQFKRIVTINS